MVLHSAINVLICGAYALSLLLLRRFAAARATCGDVDVDVGVAFADVAYAFAANAVVAYACRAYADCSASGSV